MKQPDLILQRLLTHEAWIRSLARQLVADEHDAEVPLPRLSYSEP